MTAASDDVHPWSPPIDTAVLNDLRARLRNTRWPDAPADSGWMLGADVAYLRELIAYWADDFDWSALEEGEDDLAHFRVTLSGLGIHFIHERAARRQGALPLLLNHGWPDSHWRYRKVIPMLTDPAAFGGDPADAFDVVVPDMPGYGYSTAPGDAMNSIEVAGLWADLMQKLGYDSYVTAGGDIGSGVSRYLALDHPDRVIAVHRMDAGLPVYLGDPALLAPEEAAFLDSAARWGAAEGAYAAIHRTKPQTAGVALTDSPAGLAAWIVEKLRSWSDCDGDVESVFTKAEIVSLLTQFWVTNSIAPSMRMYHANAAIPPEQHARRVEVPSGFSLFPGDLMHPPRAWLDRVANVVSVTEPTRGGHFAPMEQPEIYVRELRAFFRPFRSAA